MRKLLSKIEVPALVVWLALTVALMAIALVNFANIFGVLVIGLPDLMPMVMKELMGYVITAWLVYSFCLAVVLMPPYRGTSV